MGGLVRSLGLTRLYRDRRQRPNADETALQALAAELADCSARLAESEARFRDYAAAASDWYWEMDADLRFTELQPPPGPPLLIREHFIGKMRWEVVGIDPNQDAKWGRHRDALLAHEPFCGFEYEHIGKDGSTVPVKVSGVPLFDANGRFRGYRGVGHNIAEERAREADSERLRALEVALARRERFGTMGLLVSGLAHELNQPLAAVALYSKRLLALARDGRTPATEFAGTLAEILRLADLATGIVRQTRQVVRSPDSGEPRATLCCAATREVLQITKDKTAAAKITVDLTCDDAPCVAAIDPLSLQLILLNLVHNARDALVIARTAAPRIDVTVVRKLDGGIVVTVADNGPGIDAANRDAVFDAFFTTKPEGLGMGLAISRHLAEVHGGDLVLEADDDRRSAISLRLPGGEGPNRHA